MAAKEGSYIGKRNGCSLIHNYQVAMSNFISVIRENKLHELSMPFENIYPEYCSIVVLVIAEYPLKVNSFLELQQL